MSLPHHGVAIRRSPKTGFVLLVALAGCGSNSGSASNANIPDAANPDAAFDTGSPYLASGQVYKSQINSDGGTVPIPDAQVCIVGYPNIPCATTDTTGAYTMDVPIMLPAIGKPNVGFAIHASASGHLGTVLLSTASAAGLDWPSGIPLMSDAVAGAWAMQAGFTYPAESTAFIRLRILSRSNSPLTGATATLSSISGKGPVYDSEEDAGAMPNPTLTSTMSNGVVQFGNVSPGNFTITVSAPGKTCAEMTNGITLAGEWPPSGESEVVGVAVGGSITDNLLILCQ